MLSLQFSFGNLETSAIDGHYVQQKKEEKHLMTAKTQHRKNVEVHAKPETKTVLRKKLNQYKTKSDLRQDEFTVDVRIVQV